MLKGIDPRLNAEALHVLRAMGHGDTLVVADANFPSDSVARDTVWGELLRIDATAPEAVEAILTLLPLDTFVDDHVVRMEVVDAPEEIPPVQAAVQAAVDAADGREGRLASIERYAFYDAARGAYAVIQTAERRFYGCFILRKGVIAPDRG